MSTYITIPPSIARRLRGEAKKKGVTLEEFLLDILTRDMASTEKAEVYIEEAKALLDEARSVLGEGDAAKAMEKIWSSLALAVKAYALWRRGIKLETDKEVLSCLETMSEEIGEWVRDVLVHANPMYTCFYEGWCRDQQIDEALRCVEKLVLEVSKRIKD